MRYELDHIIDPTEAEQREQRINELLVKNNKLTVENNTLRTTIESLKAENARLREDTGRKRLLAATRERVTHRQEAPRAHA